MFFDLDAKQDKMDKSSERQETNRSQALFMSDAKMASYDLNRLKKIHADRMSFPDTRLKNLQKDLDKETVKKLTVE